MSIKVEVDGVLYGSAHEAAEYCAGKASVAPPHFTPVPCVENAPDPGTHDAAPVAAWTPTAGQSAALAAVDTLMARNACGLLTIVGYAGVGKTTMLRMIGAKYKNPIVVTPTGKAALRVQEASGLPARTIHRWIYKSTTDPKTGKLRFEKRVADVEIPPCRLVLIDEASMVSADLWADIWRVAKMHDLRIVAVGDGFQLPPVQEKDKPAFSLLDPAFVESLGGTRVELTEVLRQAADSPVVRASMMLREGMGIKALGELPRVDREDLILVCAETRKVGGIVIAATNNVRFRVNAGMRENLGMADFWPHPMEPFLVLRNNYDAGFYNGEQVSFTGWKTQPDVATPVQDRYTGVKADVFFGEAIIDSQPCIICVNQLHGGLDIGGYTLSIAAELWARQHNCWHGEKLTPFLEVNFGYCYTAHKSQGSEWPYAVVLLEPNVKLDTEDGKRWAYTAVTRAKTAAAIFYGRI